MLPLKPWSPAILASPKSGATVGSLVSGETALWLDPPTDATGESTITLDWELRARPGSRGHVFAMALPGDDTSSLTLDVPKGSTPSGPSGHREGPVAAAATDRRSGGSTAASRTANSGWSIWRPRRTNRTSRACGSTGQRESTWARPEGRKPGPSISSPTGQSKSAPARLTRSRPNWARGSNCWGWSVRPSASSISILGPNRGRRG